MLFAAICTSALLSSCGRDPLVGDYEIPLVGGYRVLRTNADDVEVVSMDKKFHSCIPPKVVGIAWDNKFIVARQQQLKARGNFPGDTLPVPVPGQFSYWIVDTTATNCLGPMTEPDYLVKSRSLELEHLQMQDVSSLKHIE
ncbi:MAG TPA: DUF3997 domain-containing protein [Verrucomicrobiae bacterium]|nr:DUF3997 domain-containing protein [Verrucomicrobiae bacterium]